MEENKIRQRSEIPEEDKWAIEDIYPSDEAWEADLVKALELAKDFVQIRTQNRTGPSCMLPCQLAPLSEDVPTLQQGCCGTGHYQPHSA